MDDLISRQAVLEHLYQRLIESANNNIGVIEDAGITFEDIATERIKVWIDEVPSAQPDQPPYVAEIESEYRKAVNMPYIKKPLAKALYEVWKKHDREDTGRNET